ncbi:sugar ABC transporter permease [Ponticoccus sp. SC2-23]|uniref:carbohydrate ABC transporter permease n=1 Tax=Alexandriicola marinus TaxID=2081710 RepID=UPI000FDAF1F9|nr:sugar ABC transporter permease [Alexandriicola marinus]MBM1220923.1 sugar ABC transporter permease [Ponticoccus sp. SC6-9]MBM1225493.1 sugar ABC transporter permease [Ponticoccus sp. SC6-15]MBM1227676.1 sugar ABC transporter permease [Ponticoccus sp. SC6-38]MBM1234686.1 sugar ABC transporter permease [Ponticoccus sp. SC6-45]MBM1238178.1 sugar ABC transporter permease [Ponticoccus sp. SC6-49]MBM1244189.1 sugar ABC transporter permease [Ponticoccus sp. SC2-64]MBM1248210.1 sugar ABC transpor
MAEISADNAPKQRVKAARRALPEAWFAWLLVAPAVIFIAVIVAWPLAETVRLSFLEADLGGEEWVGLANYTDLAESRRFHDTVLRTFYWMFLSVGLKLILGLIGATLLNAAIPGRALFRVLVMPPWVIPIAIGCFGWLWLYNGHFGLISGMLQRFGIIDGPFEFLAYKSSAFYSAIVTDVWIGTPMVTLFFLAAMQGVSRDLYEAAWVDGAGRWYRFRRITIPQIMPVIVSMALLSAIWTFNSFEIIWILTQGGPRGATTTLIVDTYKTAIGNYKFGEGAARAVIIVILLAIFSLIYLFFLNKVNRRYGAK